MSNAALPQGTQSAQRFYLILSITYDAPPNHQNKMMAEDKFKQITERLASQNADVHPGKMMSSPGLKLNDKVFAFYHEEAMCFRLGKDFEPEKFGLTTASFLSPFKTKPPLKAWYFIEKEEIGFWEELADMALAFTREIK